MALSPTRVATVTLESTVALRASEEATTRVAWRRLI